MDSMRVSTYEASLSVSALFAKGRRTYIGDGTVQGRLGRSVLCAKEAVHLAASAVAAVVSVRSLSVRRSLLSTAQKRARWLATYVGSSRWLLDTPCGKG